MKPGGFTVTIHEFHLYNYTSIYSSIFTVGIDELMFKISAFLSSRV